VVIKNERILDIAAEVLARRPDATLQTIADSAGISRTTIFNRYPTRGDLIEALAMDTVARIGAVMQRVPTSMDDDVDVALLAVTVALMPLASRTIFLRLHVDTHDVLETHWIDAVTPLAVYIATLQAHGRLRQDHPYRWLTASYIGLLFAAWDEIESGEIGPVQAARLITQTWLAGAEYAG
jgi:AcrR family transcriptional regulator